MLRAGVAEWLVSSLASGTGSEYSVEYAAALLMNLALRCEKGVGKIVKGHAVHAEVLFGVVLSERRCVACLECL